MNEKLLLFDGKVIAHRGIYNNKTVFENTIEAFGAALKKQIPIELDVRLTKDKKVVVFHNQSINNIKISDLTYKDILKINNKIPLLEKVLNLINNNVPIIIDVKKQNNSFLIEKEFVKIIENYDGNYIIQSFNVSTVIWFKIKYKKTSIGLLINEINSKRKYYKYKIINYFVSPDFLSINIKNKYNFKNNFLFGWTIKTKDDYVKIKNKYNALICDNIGDIVNK